MANQRAHGGTKATTDHDRIRRWAESRGAKPSSVKRTRKKGDPGILRLDFPGYTGEGTLEEISWDEFFDKFDEQDLALVYRDKLATGKKSNFNKLVHRSTVETDDGNRASSKRGASSNGGSKRTATKRTSTSSRGSTPKRAATSTRTATSKRTAATKRGATPKRATTRTTGRSRSITVSGGTKATIDHEQIRRWAEARGAVPSAVKATRGKGDPGILRLDFPGFSGEESLYPISWDDWFEKFDAHGLALVYRDTTAAGQRSNFNKLVKRETLEERASTSSKRGATRKSSTRRTSRRRAST